MIKDYFEIYSSVENAKRDAEKLKEEDLMYFSEQEWNDLPHEYFKLRVVGATPLCAYSLLDDFDFAKFANMAYKGGLRK